MAISRFYIRCDWDLDRTRNATDNGQHFLPRDALAVGIPQRESDAGAGGGDGAESRMLDDAGAGYIPDIDVIGIPTIY